MKLKRVFVKKYKNLHDFECNFSDSNIAAFIGNNGSGKSNLLEVIARAFSNAKNYAAGKDLPLSFDPVLDCVIEYELRGMDYVLQYNFNVPAIMSRIAAAPPILNRDEVEILCEGKTLNRPAIEAALPESILLYYAGETLRLKGEAENTYDSFYKEKLKDAKSAQLPSLRFMDYFSIGDLPLLLLTAAAYKGEYYSKFLSFVGCSGIAPKFSFVLKYPGKGKGSADTYWGATGFVKYFLESARRFVTGTKDSDGQQYYMFFNGPEEFRAISENEFDLFAKLRALRHYEYLEHIGIELIKNDGTRFSSLRLSEGEKQLGLLMLLTAFTAQHECLYLFDEFDAYLHMNWQRQFAKNIASTDVLGHVLFTTHSAGTVSGTKKQNVFIMADGKAGPVPSETYNRSLDEILEEHMLVSMRPHEYTELVQEFRNAVIHNNIDTAMAKLEQIQEIVGENDPFFITAKIAINRMGKE